MKTERDLFNLANKLEGLGQKLVRFREPDIGYGLTAIAILPSDNLKKLMSGIPLCGKNTTTDEERKARLQKLKETVRAMESCEQTSGINMLQHGLMVQQKFSEIVTTLQKKEFFDLGALGYRVPRWDVPHLETFLEKLLEPFTVNLYTTWHDCGKPVCKEVDKNGRNHYPNHAEHSARVFGELFSTETVAQTLIRRDMECHTLKLSSPEEIQFFLRDGEGVAITLLLAALAEIHANASLFQGLDSTSFKIKFKHLEKFGRRLLGRTTP